MTITQDEKEGLTPVRLSATIPDTIADRIADAMTTLHDWTITTFQFEGRLLLGSVEALGEAVGDIEEIFFRGEW